MVFYKDTNGLWRVGNYILPAGSLFMMVDVANELITLMWQDRTTIYQKPIPVTSIVDSTAAAYADLDAFLLATADFFK